MSSMGKARVIRLGKLEAHPNADRLWLTEVDGMTVCTGKDNNFSEGDLVYYVPPDMYIDRDDPIFSFLTEKRIKAKRLRGIMSYGFLLPSKYGGNEGDDVTERLGLIKYEDFLDKNSPKSDNDDFKVFASVGPSGGVNYTDIENIKKYYKSLESVGDIVVTEKIHGQNGKFVYQNGKLFVGSRTRWVAADNSNWWKIARQYDLEKVLSEFENLIVFGEVYGDVQDMKYECKQGELRFRVFDIYDISREKYLDYNEYEETRVKMSFLGCPVLYLGPWQGLDHIKELAESDSVVDTHKGIREGVVVRPITERYDHRIGRVILKYVSDRYLLRK